MSLKTRQNPDNGAIEVFYEGRWVPFAEYRRKQIDEAYQNSIKFLRDRLDDDIDRPEDKEESNQSNQGNQ